MHPEQQRNKNKRKQRKCHAIGHYQDKYHNRKCMNEQQLGNKVTELSRYIRTAWEQTTKQMKVLYNQQTMLENTARVKQLWK